MQCETENLSRLPDIQRGKDATLSLLAEYRQHPEQYDNNLASDAAIGYYYHALYHRMEQGYRDYPVEGKDYSIFSLLAQNKKLLRTNLPDGKEYQSFYQAFKLAGSLFHVFEEDTVDALVSYGEGDAIRGNLSSARANYDAAYVKEQIMLAKPYTVSLYRYQVEALLRQGALELLRCGVYALTGHYDKDTGFCESSPLEFLGV